jgi:hypothetical protein
MMKGKQGYLKKLIERGDSQPWNCPKAHLNQLYKKIISRRDNRQSWLVDQDLSITKECKPSWPFGWYWVQGVDGKICFYWPIYMLVIGVTSGI